METIKPGMITNVCGSIEYRNITFSGPIELPKNSVLIHCLIKGSLKK